MKYNLRTFISDVIVVSLVVFFIFYMAAAFYTLQWGAQEAAQAVKVK